MKDGFEDWFYEMEGFHIRAERFWTDYETQNRDVMIEWLRTAYQMGYENQQKLYGGTD
jgi:hypothetical protein